MWRNMLIDFSLIKAAKKNALKKYIKICFFSGLSFFLYSTGCSNVLSNFSNTEDDISLYYAAREYVRKALYTDALTSCALISPLYLAKPEVTDICASAYAGRCGFNLLDMVSDLDTYATTPPAEKIFHWLILRYGGTTASSITDCGSAESLIRAQGAASLRTNDQNAFMVMLSLQTIYTVLNETADTDENNILDGGFDACAISAANAQVVGSAFWELDKSLDQLAALPLYTNLDTAVDALCTALAAIGQDLCAAASPLGLAAAELKGARSLLKEGAATGVNQCGGGASVATCNCP